MRGEFYTFQKGSHFGRIAKFSYLLCLGVLSTGLGARAATAADSHCFAINVRLNGQPIEGPQSVTLKTKKTEDTVALEQKCFKVPDAIVESELIEVSFTVPGNRIHMTDVPPDFLNGMWDVDLADKKFGKEVTLPKHANVSEVCAVVVHSGGSDQGMAQPQCRTPLAAK